MRMPSLFRLSLTAGFLSVAGMVPMVDVWLRTYMLNNNYPDYCLDRIHDVSEQPHIALQTTTFPPGFSCIDTDTGQAITEHFPSGWLLLAWPLFFAVLLIGDYAHRRRLQESNTATEAQIAKSLRTWRITSALFLIATVPFIHYGFTVAHATGVPQQFCADLVGHTGEHALYSVQSYGPALTVGCYAGTEEVAHQTLWSNWLFLALAGVVWWGPAAIIRTYRAGTPAATGQEEASPASARA